MHFKKIIILSAVLLMALIFQGCSGDGEHSIRNVVVLADQPGPTILLNHGLASIVRGNTGYTLSFKVTPADMRTITSIAFQYSEDGVNFADVVSLPLDAQSYDWTSPPVDIMTAQLRLIAVDDFGKKSSEVLPPFEIRTKPPILTVDAGQDGKVNRDNSMQFSGDCERDFSVTVDVAVNGGAFQPVSSLKCANQRWQFLASATNDGNRQYRFTEVDPVDLRSEIFTRWTRDTVPPALTLAGATEFVSNTASRLFSGTCESNLNVKIEWVRGNAKQAASAACVGGAWNYTANPGGDGLWTYTFSQTDLALNSSAVSAKWTRDILPPQIKLYLGAIVPVADACKTAPQLQNPIALRQVPYDFCAIDDATGTGVKDFCLRRAELGMPLATDPCWFPVGNVDKRAVLNDNLNNMIAYVRDGAGNIGSDAKSIVLNVGKPPEVSIIHPTAGELIQGYWSAGQAKRVVFSAVDDDTAVKDIRYYITLMKANDPTKYWHLGCNFNDVAGSSYRICPDPGLQNKSGFAGPDGSGVMSFDFTVPSGWDITQKYLALVTAIDKSGNAAVVSTQEINAPWEVLAGRTYGGLGGSGVTIQVKSRGETAIAANTRGEIFQTNGHYKLNAFDHRSCRYLRKPNTTTPCDCDDVIDSSGTPAGTGWVYNAKKDVFYAISSDRNFIFELNFNVKPKSMLYTIFGAGATSLTTSLPSNALAVDYGKTKVQTLFYSNKMNRLFFQTGGSVYSIDENGKLTFVFGSGNRVEYPADQLNVAQSSLILPSIDFAFAISEDGRAIISGLGGFQTHTYYLIEGLSQVDSSAKVSLRKLYVTNALVQIDLDETNKRFLTTVSGQFIGQIPLPPLGSPLSAYPFSRLVSTMRQFAYTGGDLIYGIDPNNGMVTSFNLKAPASATNPEVMIGFTIGGEPDQYGQNRRLFYPRSLFFDPQGMLVFNDRYNLQRITPENNTSPSVVKTLVKNFPVQNMKYEPATGKLLSSVSNTLQIRDYANLMAPATTLGPIAGMNGYETAYGFANNSRNTFFFSATFDNTLFQMKGASVQLFDFEAKTRVAMTNPDTLGYLVPYCNGTERCAQGAIQTASNGAKYINFSDLRSHPQGTGIQSTAAVSTVVSDAKDENLYACISNQFMKLNFASQRAYLFTGKDAKGVNLTCSDTQAVFYINAGNIYWAQGGDFYRIDTTNIDVNNTANFIVENADVTPFSIYGSRIYGAMLMEGQYIYFTDQTLQRVIRLRRRP